MIEGNLKLPIDDCTKNLLYIQRLILRVLLGNTNQQRTELISVKLTGNTHLKKKSNKNKISNRVCHLIIYIK